MTLVRLAWVGVPLLFLAACGGGGGDSAPAAPAVTAATAVVPPEGGVALEVVGEGFPGRPGDPVSVRLRTARAGTACVPSSWVVPGTRASEILVQATAPATGLLADAPAFVEVEFSDGSQASSAGPIVLLEGAADPDRDQDGDAVPDACDEDTYDFRSTPLGARPVGVEAVGAGSSALQGVAGGGVAYAGAASGVQDRLVRVRSDDRGFDFDVYADFDPSVAGWADLEIASEGSHGDAAGWGLIVQVGADGLLRFYERVWNSILTYVVGPALPESGRLRLRWRKGLGVQSTLWVDAWDGAGWSPGLASYLVLDDTLRRGLDLAVCNYHGNTRALRRLSCVRVAPEGMLTLASDTAHSSDWQVFQRDADGHAAIPLVFWHRLPDGGTVQARVVSTADGFTLPGHDWADHSRALAAAPAGARGALRVEGVPAGGNYDVHLRLLGPDGSVVAQASRRDVAVGDVWLAAGQSNMSGYSGNLSGGESPTPRAHLFGNDGVWRQGREPMDDGTNATDAVSNEQPLHSLMLAFANTAAEATGIPVGVVPAPLGGTNLHTQWKRNEADHDLRATLYGSALHRVRAAAQGVPPAGVLWFQGESDAIAARTTAQYRADLEALAANLRGDLGASGLAFLCGQLGTYSGASLPGWLAVQEAQRQAAEADPRMGLVTAVDLPRSDGIHFSVQGYRELGRRFARAALGLVHRQAVRGAASLASATTGPDGASVVLAWDAIVTGGAASLWRLRDAAGAPSVVGTTASGPTVTLVLDRALVPPAFVTYGWGTSPAAAWVQDTDGVGVPCFVDAPVAP